MWWGGVGGNKNTPQTPHSAAALVLGNPTQNFQGKKLPRVRRSPHRPASRSATSAPPRLGGEALLAQPPKTRSSPLPWRGRELPGRYEKPLFPRRNRRGSAAGSDRAGRGRGRLT